jgi:hypothetical protein
VFTRGRYLLAKRRVCDALECVCLFVCAFMCALTRMFLCTSRRHAVFVMPLYVCACMCVLTLRALLHVFLCPAGDARALVMPLYMCPSMCLCMRAIIHVPLNMCPSMCLYMRAIIRVLGCTSRRQAALVMPGSLQSTAASSSSTACPRMPALSGHTYKGTHTRTHI